MKIIMDGGVEVNEIADKSAFQEAMVPVYEKYLAANPEMTDLVNLFRNAD
jgi:TRAP-type C4-dicarboxylate transport system substrate-binding protein